MVERPQGAIGEALVEALDLARVEADRRQAHAAVVERLGRRAGDARPADPRSVAGLDDRRGARLLRLEARHDERDGTLARDDQERDALHGLAGEAGQVAQVRTDADQQGGETVLDDRLAAGGQPGCETIGGDLAGGLTHVRRVAGDRPTCRAARPAGAYRPASASTSGAIESMAWPGIV